MTPNEDDFWNELLVRGGISVAECRTAEDAQFLVFLLSERGIRAAILLPANKMDLRLPQIRVPPEDAQQARQVLAEPVPPGMREEYDAEPEIDFYPPRCLACRSEDVVLEGMELGNHWRCGRCGKTWTEIVTEPPPES